MYRLKKIILNWKRKIKESKILNLILLIILILIVLFQIRIMTDIRNNIGDPRPTAIIKVTSTPHGTDPDAIHISPSPSYQQSGISIPVQDKIYFTSNSTIQEVSFVNPDENNCGFIVSLTLPDSTTIYRSKLIPPGMAIYRIELTDTLATGEHKDAVLTYECYREDGTKLNSAVFKVDIIVR